MRTILFFFLFAMAMVVSADNVVAPGAKLEKLAGDFLFTEGPTCDAKGNLFFVDQPNDRIMRWSTADHLQAAVRPRQRNVF